MVKKLIKTFIFDFRKAVAIRKAKRNAALDGKRYLVLMYRGKPDVISMQNLKLLIKRGKFAKGFTAEKAREIAIYVTK